MNVLKLHSQSTVFTLLGRKKSQHEIQRLTGIDRKTIRRYEQLYRAQAANSPTLATGSGQALEQTSPPWPPAPVAVADSVLDACPARARSACEAYRVWIEEQVRLKRCRGVPLFEPAAIETLFQATQGLPRKINRTAHYALSAAALAKLRQISTEHVQAALEEVQ